MHNLVTVADHVGHFWTATQQIYVEKKTNSDKNCKNSTQMLEITKADNFAGFLTQGKCFRYNIAKNRPYKGNRKYSDFYKFSIC